MRAEKHTALSVLIILAILGCSKSKNELPVFASIPVIFHIAHDGEPVGIRKNISELTIARTLEEMNRNFKFMNIHFILAELDTNGIRLNEPGVNRFIASQKHYTIAEAWHYADSVFWNEREYLNIFIINASDENFIGSGRFPFTILENPLAGLEITHNPDWDMRGADGIVVNYDYLTIDDHLVTHELGHFFGLFHTFKTSCDFDSADTDYCDDTPVYGRREYEEDFDSLIRLGDTNYRMSCDGILFEANNFMDYWDTNPNQVFTMDQKKRMRHVLKYSPRRRELSGSNKYSQSFRPPFEHQEHATDFVY